MKQSILEIPELCCPTEERLLRSRLERLHGVGRLEFDFLAREVRILHRLSDPGPLLAAVRAAGMEARLKPEAARSDGMAKRAPAGARRGWGRLAVAGAAAVAAETLSWFAESGAPIPAALVLGAALVALAASSETFRRALEALRRRAVTIHVLMLLAIAGAFLLGEWPEAAMVSALFALADRLEAHSADRARRAIRALFEQAPPRASVRQPDGAWREVETAVVGVGEIFRVRPGERVPLDGVVLSGRSAVDEASVTGESLPVEKGPGDPVYAGTLNGRGALEVRVTAAAEETVLARTLRAVEAARSRRAPIERQVDRFARIYTPAVTLAALLVAGAPPLLFGQPAGPWLYRGLVFLVIACPCALVLATPVTLVSALAAAARRGILVRGGAFVEAGARLRAVAFDKTGTLTCGEPVVTEVWLPGSAADEEGARARALQVAASLEMPSEHPLAGAILAAWEGLGPERPPLLPVEGFEALPGRGVRGRIGGTAYALGSLRLWRELAGSGAQGASSMREAAAAVRALEAEGKTAVLLLREGEPCAVFGVADALRPSSPAAVEALRALGLRTLLLTGDHAAAARAVAGRLGIDDVRAGLLPEEKLAAIREFERRHGPVAMVGDGINDTPALAGATLGVALGAAGTDAALETADVALMGPDLRALGDFLRLCRRAVRVLRQNVALAVGIKLLFFGLALAGAASLWMAVLADMGGSLLVLANGLRLLREGGAERKGPTAARP